MQLEALSNENEQLKRQLEDALCKAEVVCRVISILVLLHHDCYYCECIFIFI